ncbi:MAG: type II secretion system F family protein [Bdellovibrionota bacterium]
MGSSFSILSSLIVVMFIGGAAFFGYPWVEEFTRKKLEGYLQECELLLHRMFKEMPRKKMIMIIAGSTFFLGLVGFVLTLGFGWINILFTVTLAAIGYQSFRMWLKFFWERRLNEFNEQLVDALNLLANSLKSGLNLSQALQVLIQESKPPMSQEFGLVLSQRKLGLTIDEGLGKNARAHSQRRSGRCYPLGFDSARNGWRLSETFETIASTIRERRKVSGKIKSMTQQGKMQGLILLLCHSVLVPCFTSSTTVHHSTWSPPNLAGS